MTAAAQKESTIQADILSEFKADPFVAWAMTTTTGRAKMNGYWVSLGTPGVPDILGQLIDGRLFGYEVKQPGKKPTDIQLAFIDQINRNKGHASWGCCVLDAVRWLSSIKPVATASATPAQRKGGSGAKGTRLPEDWELPEEWESWAKSFRPTLDTSLEADKFKDYWLAKSGANAVKLDWRRTWRNWVRNSTQWSKENETRQRSGSSADKKDWLDQELF